MACRLRSGSWKEDLRHWTRQRLQDITSLPDNSHSKYYIDEMLINLQLALKYWFCIWIDYKMKIIETNYYICQDVFIWLSIIL